MPEIKNPTAWNSEELPRVGKKVARGEKKLVVEDEGFIKTLKTKKSEKS